MSGIRYTSFLLFSCPRNGSEHSISSVSVPSALLLRFSVYISDCVPNQGPIFEPKHLEYRKRVKDMASLEGELVELANLQTQCKWLDYGTVANPLKVHQHGRYGG